ncbi:hypothetical protein CSV77_04945 [Sporosarcina sp. P16b]|uniref:DUF6978 family protein n=1 Tax=Sporosarcina sp. P16b TaxID=2048261 RepID=UPI000C16821E|nr:hypothetical protein [Sporosarcina sp. P16b]PIC71378.1 hypothetical protein CSV77_04945 [Sporosarcina sp. P16b]
MRELNLTDEEAKTLIEMLKMLLQKYNIDLKPDNKGVINLKGEITGEFFLHYYTPRYRDDKISIHLRDKETNHNLVRVNIDPVGFHNNADGVTIAGNRILLFSSEEWVRKKEKGDDKTHVRAFNLPSQFTDTSSLEQVFLDFIEYINVKREGKITFAGLI